MMWTTIQEKMKEIIKSGEGQMKNIKKFNADMFYLIPEDYREF